MLRLDQFPMEILAYLATYLDTCSLLSLASTNSALRTATNDHQIYKAILCASHMRLQDNENLPDLSLDFSALAIRCASNPNLWARYALAYEITTDYLMSLPSSMPKDLMPSLPALHLIGYQACFYFFRIPRTPSHEENVDERHPMLFSLALTILSCPARELPPRRSAYFLSRTTAESTTTDLHALAKVVSDIRNAVPARQHGWRYNRDPRVPPPVLTRIPLKPRDATYELPLPFENASAWQRWYETHCLAAFHDDDFMLGGSWCGYQTYMSHNFARMESAMEGLRFVAEEGTDVVDKETGLRVGFETRAEGCKSGGENLSVVGKFYVNERAVRFAGEVWFSDGLRWRWELRLTPLGLVGYFGGSKSRSGYVWLWKEDWSRGNSTIESEVL